MFIQGGMFIPDSRVYETQRYWVHFFVQKTKDFEENNFNVRFGGCSFFTSKPHYIESHLYKVTS